VLGVDFFDLFFHDGPCEDVMSQRQRFIKVRVSLAQSRFICETATVMICSEILVLMILYTGLKEEEEKRFHPPVRRR
jgi:hypothetical protein